MSHQHEHGHGQHEPAGKHYQPPSHRLARTLDAILAVVTADLVVNLGVFASGLVVMAIELGWVHPPEQRSPQPVVVVRHVSTHDGRTPSHN